VLSTTIDRIVCLPLPQAPSKSGTRPSMSLHHHYLQTTCPDYSRTIHIYDCPWMTFRCRTSSISNLAFQTSVETITALKFNLAESSIIASCGSDRTFTLYDIRTSKAERRVVMHFQSTSLSWSPTLPTLLLLASEDHNLYTFDVRHLDHPTQIYKAHSSAVTSCEWSPTGMEFVSGGWDKTVRIWQFKDGKAAQRPEVYHTKRMQRCVKVKY